MQASYGGHTAELSVIVAVNEDIKIIRCIASEINLAALNAMLIANQAGSASSGFSVVSAELRVFSRRVGEMMLTLSGHVAVLVSETATMIRRNRMMALQLRTQQAMPGDKRLDAVLEHKSDEIAQSRLAIEHCHEQLSLAVARAKKLCAMGRALAYSAKIEAECGGKQAAALRQVSGDVAVSIGEIHRALEQLGKRLDGMT